MNTRFVGPKLDSLCVGPDASIRQAIARIDGSGCGIALVLDGARRLLGTITDGDIRRAMLGNVDLGFPVSAILERKLQSENARPVTAPAATPPEALLQLMRERSVRQVPLLDDSGQVVGLVTQDDLLPPAPLPLQAVVMAGGFGTRLRPLTEDLPKPMLPVGGRPLLEHTIAQLQQLGIRRINVTTHYKPEKIIEHFGNGSAFGVELTYVNEDLPLGTGGALGLMPTPSEPLLVINGDILTDVDFRAMLAYHQENRAVLTVAVRRYEMQVPYGVIECEGSLVRRLQEKPQVGFLVNAGIYLLEPKVFEHIQHGQPFHMTDLIQRLLDAGQVVISFPVREYWLDIGQHADYVQAQTDVAEGRMDA
jgi:dTDP-glucose pyrophosphorylase/CBS domain-containing protein